jgi:hypothetical protein
MRRTVAGLWVLACCGAAAGQSPAAREAWRALFAQSQPHRAVEHIEAVLDAVGHDPNRLRRLIATDTAYPQAAPGWGRYAVTVPRGDERKTDVTFHVYVPPGYTPQRSWPVLVAHHGQGGDGNAFGRWARDLLGPDRDKYVIISPTFPEKMFTARPWHIDAVTAPLELMRRRLNLDDDRIYVTGYSQGGHISWHLGVMYGWQYAAAVPMAGMPNFRGQQLTFDLYLGNLRGRALWAVWGADDQAGAGQLGVAGVCRTSMRRIERLGIATVRGTELAGVDHAGAVPEPNDFARPVRVAVPARGRRPTKEEIRLAMQKQVARRMYRLGGRLDRDKGELTVRGSFIGRVRVYVADGLFADPNRVTVRFGRQEFSGPIPASPRCMLEHYARTRDAGRLIINELDLALAKPPRLRYPADQ